MRTWIVYRGSSGYADYCVTIEANTEEAMLKELDAAVRNLMGETGCDHTEVEVGEIINNRSVKFTLE